MLRIIQNNSPAGASRYYGAADYYIDGQELAGMWRGRAAARLGLSGTVQRADWDALCDNRDPATGGPLTVRRKEGRRVGYDFNFHVPKSVSLLYGLTGDERVMAAFRASVDATMRDIESEMQTRVRASGRNEDRTTGNMVWGEFVHLTARPVDGVPDPHLHAHCFVFNTTWDSEESRWKAGQFAGLKRDGSYFEALFHSRLAGRLEELGLATERTKTGWELAFVPPAAIEKFSRRTALIEERAEADGITGPVAKAELGAKTRERKAEGLTLAELRRVWDARLSEAERSALASVAAQVGRDPLPRDATSAQRAVAQAMEHCFERAAVVPERRLLAEAMRRSVGKATPKAVARDFDRRGLITAERDGRRLATSREVLAEESRMLRFAREGRGACRPLGGTDHEFRHKKLNKDQRRAVLHVLTSRDRVMLVRGGAGTGKTTMMREAVEAIEDGGKRVHVFAPSAEASRGVLRDAEGFAGADTVARLLIDTDLQESVRGQVVWVDEAGLLGSRATAALFDLADRAEARLILSGDKRQHGSVERGAALRLLEEEAGIVPAELREIERQKDRYKDAVRALSEGRVKDGFETLDDLGWLHEVDDAERYQRLADDYARTVESGRTALVVSPTHREGERVTAAIRDRLRQAGRLDAWERPVPMLVNRNLTEAERADALSYNTGDVLVFHQNAVGYKKGERVAVGDTPLPLDQAARFQVFRASELPLAAGDLVRVTRNGSTADGAHRLNNGATYQIKRFDRQGPIVLANGWKLAADYGHLAHGYVTTSHASQGRTVDRSIIAQSSESFPASGMEQFYVSASRARQSVALYTDDKEALLDAVSREDERLTATDLVNGRGRDRGLSQPPRDMSGDRVCARDREIEHER